MFLESCSIFSRCLYLSGHTAREPREEHSSEDRAATPAERRGRGETGRKMFAGSGDYEAESGNLSGRRGLEFNLQREGEKTKVFHLLKCLQFIL